MRPSFRPLTTLAELTTISFVFPPASQYANLDAKFKNGGVSHSMYTPLPYYSSVLELIFIDVRLDGFQLTERAFHSSSLNLSISRQPG